MSLSLSSSLSSNCGSGPSRSASSLSPRPSNANCKFSIIELSEFWSEDELAVECLLRFEVENSTGILLAIQLLSIMAGGPPFHSPQGHPSEIQRHPSMQ